MVADLLPVAAHSVEPVVSWFAAGAAAPGAANLQQAAAAIADQAAATAAYSFPAHDAATSSLLLSSAIQDFRDAVGSVFPSPVLLLGTLLLPLVPLLLLIARGVGKVAESAVTSATAVSLADIPTEAWLRLLVCLLIDAGGDTSFALPGPLAGASDWVFAPLEAYVLSRVFPGAGTVAGLGFLEEFLPFTDAIPTATIAWVLETLYPTSWASKLLGLDKRRAQYEAAAVREAKGDTGKAKKDKKWFS